VPTIGRRLTPDPAGTAHPTNQQSRGPGAPRERFFRRWIGRRRTRPGWGSRRAGRSEERRV